MARRERDPDVPRLPRGRGFKLSFGEVIRIGLTGTMLVAVLFLAKPCADAVGTFVANFDPPDAQPAAAAPQKLPAGYVHLTPNMSQQQLEQAIGAARDAGVAPQDATAAAPAPTPGSAAPAPALTPAPPR